MRRSRIDYGRLVESALRTVVRDVLQRVCSDGASPPHHFYITFKTQAPGVDIPQRLVERFPDEMTIVLQNRFWDLTVDENRFSVGLSFNQVPSKLVIPYSAITRFQDPEVQFELGFHVADDPQGDPDPHDSAENDEPVAKQVEDGSNVVAVDFKRKK